MGRDCRRDVLGSLFIYVVVRVIRFEFLTPLSEAW